MAINPIAGVTPVTGTGYLPSANASKADDSGFATVLTGAVDNLQRLQTSSNELAVQAVTGTLDDIHTAIIASTRAQVTLEVVAAVRNKAVEAFNDIMRMQA